MRLAQDVNEKENCHHILEGKLWARAYNRRYMYNGIQKAGGAPIWQLRGVWAKRV